MVKLNKNRSENFLAFVSSRARSGSRPNCAWHTSQQAFDVSFQRGYEIEITLQRRLTSMECRIDVVFPTLFEQEKSASLQRRIDVTWNDVEIMTLKQFSYETFLKVVSTLFLPFFNVI